MISPHRQQHAGSESSINCGIEAMGVRRHVEAKCVSSVDGASAYVSLSRLERAKRQGKAAVREAGLRCGLASSLVAMDNGGRGQWRTNWHGFRWAPAGVSRAGDPGEGTAGVKVL